MPCGRGVRHGAAAGGPQGPGLRGHADGGPDPELLILDEPTQGMDVAGRRGFWTAIREDAAWGQMIIFRTRARRCLHRPHRLNGRSPDQKDLPLNATCPTARIRTEELT